MRREIGSSQQMAMKEHFCDRCLRYIHPGEIYERAVYLNEPRIVADKERFAIKLDDRHRIYVEKIHVEPKCIPPWEDEDSEEYQIEKEMREEAERAAQEQKDGDSVAA